MMKREAILQKDRRKAMLLSVLIFLMVVAVCFFLTAFTIQDPPPGDQYVAIGMADFGDVLEAGGASESEVPSEEVSDQEQSQASETSEAATDVATQTSSDVSVSSSPKPTSKPKPDPTPSKELGSALDQLTKPSSGGGKGDQQGGGDQGDLSGQIGGTGVNQGDLDGKGWSLGGRTQGVKPTIKDPFNEEGIVVVDIVVNQKGEVVRATANIEHSLTNTPSSALHRLAEKAAKSARFNQDFSANVEQKGAIVIRFVLE